MSSAFCRRILTCYARPDATVVTLDGPHLLLQARPHAAAEVLCWELASWFAKRQS